MFVAADDGCRLHTIPGDGSAPALVLSNSLGTELSLWDAQVDILADKRSIWRYDTRGHGGSDVPAGEYSIERLGRDLLSIIDATGLPAVDLCGISIGGLTALWVAIHAPHRVKRLILANTAARIGSIESWTERMRTVRAGGMRSLANVTMDRWFTPSFRMDHPETVDMFRVALEGTYVDGYAGCCAALRDADLRAAAPLVACPTLVIAGRGDVATPSQDGRWLADTIRGARFVELDAAHLSNVEDPNGFNHAVRTFLDEGHHG